MLIFWPSRRAAPTDGLLLLVAGQSNATRRASQVTTSYRPWFYTFSGLNEPVDRTDGQAVTQWLPGSIFASLAAFSEFGVNSESLAPGYAAVDTHGQILTHTAAIGARHYRELMRGLGPWDSLLQAIMHGQALLEARGVTSLDIVMLWDHGEADADTIAPGGGAEGTTITQGQYLDVLEDLVLQYTYCLKLCTLDPDAVPVIWAAMPVLCPTDGYRNVMNAHLEAAQTITGYNLIGPKYAYAHETDGTHITGAGKRLFAEYAAHRVAGGGLPVHITSASRSGAVITLDYHTLTGDLVIDTTAVPQTSTAYTDSLSGFECLVSGSAVGIDTVQVSGTAVTITLDSDPGEAVLVRYAMQTWPGGTQTVAGINSKLPRGNIRDSGSFTALQDGSTLYNWAVPQFITTST